MDDHVEIWLAIVLSMLVMFVCFVALVKINLNQREQIKLHQKWIKFNFPPGYHPEARLARLLADVEDHFKVRNAKTCQDSQALFQLRHLVFNTSKDIRTLDEVLNLSTEERLKEITTAYADIEFDDQGGYKIVTKE
jgi:hypothetical protein